MTPDQRPMLVWGGGTFALIVVGLCVLAARDGTLTRTAAQANELEGRYAKLYHPDTPADGMPVADALQVLSRARDQQLQALEKAESVLVPELPSSYLVTDVNSASAQVHIDHLAIKQRAQSMRIEIPAVLPYDSGPLDADQGKRTVQLAYLYLYRAVLDQCLDAGVTRVNGVTIGKTERDPTGSYLLLTCDVDLDCQYESGQKLLQNLLQAKGIGVHSLLIHQVPQQTDGHQHMHLTASLITASHAPAAAPAPPSARPPASAPALAPDADSSAAPDASPSSAPVPTTPRLRRLGGGS